MHVVDAPGANVIDAQPTLPPGTVPDRFVIGAVPVFDTEIVTVTLLPVGTDGPGAAPAGWPLTDGTPTVRMPCDGAPPVKNTDVEPVNGEPLLVPVNEIVTVFAPEATGRDIVHVVDAPGANVADAQLTAPPGAVAARFVIGAVPVFDTVTLIGAVPPVGSVGPGDVPAGVPLMVGAPIVKMPCDGAPPVKNTDTEPDNDEPLLTPVNEIVSVLAPWTTGRLIVHVVDAPGANVAAPHVTPPPGAIAAKLVIGEPPVFDTVTLIEAELPVGSVGPGDVPAG